MGKMTGPALQPLRTRSRSRSKMSSQARNTAAHESLGDMPAEANKEEPPQTVRFFLFRSINVVSSLLLSCAIEKQCLCACVVLQKSHTATNLDRRTGFQQKLESIVRVFFVLLRIENWDSVTSSSSSFH